MLILISVGSLESLVLFSRFGYQLLGVTLVRVVGCRGSGGHVVVLRREGIWNTNSWCRIKEQATWKLDIFLIGFLNPIVTNASYRKLYLLSAWKNSLDEDDDNYRLFPQLKSRSKDLNDVKIDELGHAPAYPVPSLRFVCVSSNVG